MTEPTYETTARIHAVLGGDYKSVIKTHRLQLMEATAKQAAFRAASKQEVAVGYELLADAFVVIRELLDIIERPTHLLSVDLLNNTATLDGQQIPVMVLAEGDDIPEIFRLPNDPAGRSS